MKYKVEFYSNWHCGSGQTAGADIDALVIKDIDGLPFIPGKTIKGLMREAVANILHFQEKDESLLDDLFGSENRQGTLYFPNATLSEPLIHAIKNAEDIDRTMFFQSFSSTAISEEGVAKDHSLRRIETVIPCTLYGDIIGVEHDCQEVISMALSLIKRLGVGRNRGLGRCEFSKID